MIYTNEKSCTHYYIDMDEIVNLTQEHLREAERIENDPAKILALIDLIFMYDDREKIPS